MPYVRRNRSHLGRVGSFVQLLKWRGKLPGVSAPRAELPPEPDPKDSSVAKMTMGTLSLPSEYGYVCLVLFATVLIHHFYMSFAVGAARKKCVLLCRYLSVCSFCDLFT